MLMEQTGKPQEIPIKPFFKGLKGKPNFTKREVRKQL